jgi:hypothetical protein
MQVSNTNPASSLMNPSDTSSPNAKGSQGAGSSSFQSLLSQLNSFVDGSPSQRMENSILAQLGYTQQQLQQMTPAQRAQVEEKVRELVKKEMGSQQQTQSTTAANGINGDLAI